VIERESDRIKFVTIHYFQHVGRVETHISFVVMFALFVFRPVKHRYRYIDSFVDNKDVFKPSAVPVSLIWCLSCVVRVTNLALWLQYFNKLTYLLIVVLP